MKNLRVFLFAAIAATNPMLMKAQKGVVSVETITPEPPAKVVKFINNIKFDRSRAKATTTELVTAEANYDAPTTTTTKKVVTKAAEATTYIELCTPLQFKYAQILNVPVETLQNTALLSFIEDWWATRYRYGGTNRSGIDCSAYTGKLYQTAYNINIPRTAREQYRVAEKISRANLAEGDLVFFNTRGGVSHVGVYIGNGFFTHSSSGNGVTINNLTESYYSARYIGGGRIASTYKITEPQPEVDADITTEDDKEQ
jgi:cell wall-associated NlpC family hydrolase